MDTLQSFFEKQYSIFPDKVCLICDSTETTYRSIEESANQLANWLIAQGTKPGEIIGVLIDRSTDLYIIMLGILKAGAAYLPIDPGYPHDRIEYILEDVKISLLLTTKNYADINFPAEKMIKYETIKQDLVAESKEKPFVPTLTPKSLCYVIYTSGTTGTPKGIAISHAALYNYVQSALKIYGVTDQDRIYQGFTIGFDASMEEIWLAFASGGVLITSSAQAVQEGGALADFLNFNKITVFSTVPTMLAMLEPPLPSLRILILGGEVCTEALIASWMRPNLKIFNTYGPAEATIITTYAECRANKKVTIGKPIPNCDILILNDQLNPVADGDSGEICIAGFGLANGYINKPELTKEKFIAYPNDPSIRIYRTGDTGRKNEEGNIEYITREDEQIKLRGFRVEPLEIEVEIKRLSGVRDAAVVVQELSKDVESLICYVVLKDKSALTPVEIQKELRKKLPRYMIPSIFMIVSSFPKMRNGKIDKKLLPKPELNDVKKILEYREPKTSAEKKITAIWEEILGVSPISINSDFFGDLGGHSLAAAKVISEMRLQHKEMSDASLLDIFENSTIEQLAKKIEDSKKLKDADKADLPLDQKNIIDKAQYCICVFFQAWVSLVLVTISPWHFLIILLISVTFTYNYYLLLTWGQLTQCFLAFFFLLEPSLILFGVIMKWLLLGKIKPGQYKVWSLYYLRWWVVNQLQDMAPIDHFVGSPFITFYCRLMGAKIGKNCYIGTDVFNAFDLFSMGDNSSLGADVIVSGYKIEDGWLKIGSIKIGDNCFVGANSVLSINTELKNGSKLGEHSLLPMGETIQENESLMGSPARPGEIELPNIADKISSNNIFKSFLHVFFHYLLLMLVEIVYITSVAPGIILTVYFCYITGQYINCFWTVPLSAFMFMFLFVTQISFLKFIFRPIKKGDYSLKSFAYLKIWFCERLMGLSLGAMESLYGTIYTASWFRLLGAKIGKRSEIATINFSPPDMLNMGQECFVGDGAILAPVRVYNGYMRLQPIYLGHRVFVGNGALIPQNTKLNNNCLIACASTTPDDIVASDTSWIGVPAIFLPRRNLSKSYSDSKTYEPNRRSLVTRGIFEFFKIFLPPVFLYGILSLDVIAFVTLNNAYSLLVTIFIFPFFSILFVLGEVYLITLLKWLLIGTYKNVAAPMYSSFVYRSEFLTSLYDNVMVPFILEPSLGTPFIVYFLRMLGAKIGKYTVINTPYFSEFDLVEVGDNAFINKDSTVQTHLYEDRVFQTGTIKIESGCTVGDRSILLYDTVMQRYSTLGDFSLLMKGEILYQSSEWIGIPAERIYRSKFSGQFKKY